MIHFHFLDFSHHFLDQLQLLFVFLFRVIARNGITLSTLSPSASHISGSIDDPTMISEIFNILFTNVVWKNIIMQSVDKILVLIAILNLGRCCIIQVEFHLSLFSLTNNMTEIIVDSIRMSISTFQSSNCKSKQLTKISKMYQKCNDYFRTHYHYCKNKHTFIHLYLLVVFLKNWVSLAEVYK